MVLALGALLSAAAYAAEAVAPVRVVPEAGIADPAALARDPGPSGERVGDQVGRPARITAAPEPVTAPTRPATPAPPEPAAPDAPPAGYPPRPAPVPAPQPPTAPPPPVPEAPAAPDPPVGAPARPPGGFTDEEIRRGLEVWEQLSR
ncbi:hypothetical protein [Streptomonospora litoralis]|uniref:hypothetical protein n=1 Tax=Streptomonospora litoralis TaxID=2498135 RepID=UPI0010367FEA|nr:hypothetical protein [Streptomonospora litoralis]